MTSSIKPEVHNVSQCCQRRTKLRPQATCVKNLVKFGHAVFELCKWRDRQTNKQTDTPITILRTLPGGEVKISFKLHTAYEAHIGTNSGSRKYTKDLNVGNSKSDVPKQIRKAPNVIRDTSRHSRSRHIVGFNV